MNMYTIYNFPFKVLKRYKYVPNSKKDKKYVDSCNAFDIETTTIKKIAQSFMYIWSFSVNGEYWITGRTWDEFFLSANENQIIQQTKRPLCYIRA